MKDKARSIRFSTDVIAILKRYQEEHGFKTLTEALEDYIVRRPSQELNTPIEMETEDIECKKRTKGADGYYCAENAPKLTKLLCLDVCRVCKLIKYGFPNPMPRPLESSEMKGISETKPHTPKRIYCPMTTDFVDRQAICGKCHQSHYPTWLKCETRLKQEAREQ